MKKLLLFIAIAIMGMKAVAQVPVNFLVYRQDFTGNFTDTSSFGPAVSDVNTATLQSDEYNTPSSVGNFDLGQTIEYPFSTNSQLMAGPTQMSISVKVYFDPTWLAGLPSGQYITFLKLGESYMRLYKAGGTYLLQCGVFNNNPTSGSFGYLGVSGYVADITTGWNTITMTYGPELPPNIGGALRVYLNGGYLGNSMRAVITPDNQPTSYVSSTEKLVLGKTSSSNNNFKGKIDRVLIYSVRLTPAEVMAIQNEGRSLTEYTFNNTYNNIYGAEPFNSASGITFVNDRNGNPNSALNFNSTNGTQATIMNLPYNNYPRTISIWVKPNSIQSGYYYYPFLYGTDTSYLLSHYRANDVTLSDAINFMSVATTNTPGVWMHYVYVCDTVNIKIYKNGVLLGSIPMTTTTTNNNNIFKLGYSIGSYPNLDAALDDLKIYKYALSDNEILNLYNYNTLSTQNFNSQNLKASIFPNPTSTNFTIEIENEVKSVEIYSLQGQKVLTSTSKDINVSNLSKGMYLVRIEDNNNAVVTQKLIVK